MEDAMKALVYHGPGQKSLDERPKPDLQAPTDAIVRVTKTTICGTDLHILKGDVTTCEPGRILGHEGVGIVEKVGTARSEEHTSELQSLMRISYAVFCLKKKKATQTRNDMNTTKKVQTETNSQQL